MSSLCQIVSSCRLEVKQLHKLSGIVEFDDAYFGDPTVGKKRGRETGKAKAFMALSLYEHGNPHFRKMKLTKNIKQASVWRSAEAAFSAEVTIRSDGYRSYIPAFTAYAHEHRPCDPHAGMLHWLYIMVSNAKA